MPENNPLGRPPVRRLGTVKTEVIRWVGGGEEQLPLLDAQV